MQHLMARVWVRTRVTIRICIASGLVLQSGSVLGPVRVMDSPDDNRPEGLGWVNTQAQVGVQKWTAFVMGRRAFVGRMW